MPLSATAAASLAGSAPGLPARALLLLALLVVASAGWWLARRRAGRLRPVPAPADDGAARLTADDLRVPLGPRATLVQLSTATCATCPGVRRALGALAEEHDGVRHVDVDAEERMDLVRRLDVRRTPTVLLLDAEGVVRGRASGPLAATRAGAALAEVLDTAVPTTAVPTTAVPTTAVPTTTRSAR
ncbi:thioredoxin family protein [Actinotalea solisilvae]|uniref:thioredoxin family protein n=1 Tax=Actinotalea solisilvae TaxID=2072922 RepID=UPI0018F1DB96|nr:thioredoxin family protein [Actinotalea solisilvae]